MRSRVVRLAIGAMALVAAGASGYLLFTAEAQMAAARTRVRAFDLHAREVRDRLADLRAAQQACVAAGQGRDFWMPKVEAHREAAASGTSALGGEATSAEAKGAIGEAASAIGEFTAIDTRVRDYLGGGQELMAADMVFTEGAAAIANASSGIEKARAAEQQAFDALEARLRRQETIALAGAAALGALAILVLALSGSRGTAEPIASLEAGDAAQSLSLSRVAVASGSARREATYLQAAAEICTDFGRARDIEDVTNLLGRAAAAMEASGLVVWIGNAAGGDLRPALAHGYPAATLARLPAVPKAADNAAAAAYRTGSLQIVMAKPGVAAGAIVAPIVCAQGCIGALSIEVKGGIETSNAIQGMAAVFAAQLAGVLASSSSSAPAADAGVGDRRAAAQA
ncbi:MAG: hypothetical protein IT176_12295 [Acidobacteria bacterium]|nr:hypothetical protein [Acidobacteriota bacterium]